MSIWATTLFLTDLHEVDWPGQTERINGSFVDVAIAPAPEAGWCRLSCGGEAPRPTDRRQGEVMLAPEETRRLRDELTRLLGESK